MARRLPLLDQRLVILHAPVAPAQTGVPNGAAVLRIGLTFLSFRLDQWPGLERFALRAVEIASLVQQEPAQR